jgi:hypothetical protein
MDFRISSTPVEVVDHRKVSQGSGENQVSTEETLEEETPEIVQQMAAEVRAAIDGVDWDENALYLADETEQVGYQSWIAGYKAAGGNWPDDWPMTGIADAKP